MLHYENTPIQIYWNFHLQKQKIFRQKIWYFFYISAQNIDYISAQNIDCGYPLEPPHRGGSNEYPKSMFWAKIRKKNVYLCKPRFFCIKGGFKGVKII